MPTRLCSTPGCGNPTYRRGLCTTHAAARERPSRYAHIYHSKRWAMLQRKVITEHPICQVCDTHLSTIGDHITPLARGGRPYDPTNVQAICPTCHGIKTKREMQAP